MNILLIAGHGGTPYDPGACGCGYTEAVETRRLATAVAPMLRKYGFNVTMYDQSKDAYKVLRSGGSLPLFGIGYVLEIHLNAGVSETNGNGATTGTEVLVHTAESGVSVEQAICRRISALGFKNRGVKRRDNLQVMNTVHRAGISHALVETCFIDDADDMKLYKEKFYDIARAIADGVAEGFGKTVEEDDEVVEKKTVLVDGKEYTCECIEKDGNNFVKMRSLSQAGYNVVFDAARKLPAMTAPQCRVFVPEGDEAVQDAIDTLREACGLEEQTIAYMRKYQYGDDLVKKLAKAVQGNA